MEVYFDEYLDPKDSAKADQYHQETYKEVSTQYYVKKARFISKKEAAVIAKKQLGIDSEALFEEEIFRDMSSHPDLNNSKYLQRHLR